MSCGASARPNPGNREVLKDISLAFLPGAKIGVLGLNGAGKSTLLQYHGRPGARSSPARPGRPRAITRGLSRPRSRSSTPRPRTWLGNVHGGPGRDARPCSTRFEAGQRQVRRAARARRGDGCADRRAGRAAGKDRRGRRLGPGPPRSRSPWTRCAVRPATPRWLKLCRAASAAAWRSAACCCSQPDLLLLERADQPPGRRVRRLAGTASCRTTPGTVVADHPRPLFSGQRRRLDPRAGPRPGHSLRRATTLPGSSRKGKRVWLRRRSRSQPASGYPGPRAGVDPRQSPQGPPGQVQGAHHGLRRPCWPRTNDRAPESGADRDPRRAPAWATW